jgi:death-on-curing protein
MTRYFSEEEILLTHFKLIERFGGSHGTRDIERIRSVTVAPKQEVFGAEQYTDVFEKAAVYARNIIGDHSFIDGNKRTGIAVVYLFLLRNGKKFRAKEGEIENFAVLIATKHLDVAAIAFWLQAHCNE